jgi:hypothetical protein
MRIGNLGLSRIQVYSLEAKGYIGQDKGTSWNLKDPSGVDIWNSAMTCSRIRQALVVLCEVSLGIREACGDKIFGDTLAVGFRNDNPNTTQTLESTKDKYNAKIIK